jgi:hypothetical protein
MPGRGRTTAARGRGRDISADSDSMSNPRRRAINRARNEDSDPEYTGPSNAGVSTSRRAYAT